MHRHLNHAKRTRNDAIGGDQPSLSMVIEASAVPFHILNAKSSGGSHGHDASCHATESIVTSKMSHQCSGVSVGKVNHRDTITEGNGAHGQQNLPTNITVPFGNSQHCQVTVDCAEDYSTCQRQPASNKSNSSKPGRNPPSELESFQVMGRSKRKRSSDSMPVFKERRTAASQFQSPPPFAGMAALDCEEVPEPAASSKHGH